MMRFGTFREVAFVEYAKETQNETGEFIQTWHCYSKIRCSITSLSYSQSTRMEQAAGDTSWQCRTRFIPGLTGKMRIRWQSRYNKILYISQITEVGHEEYHTIICEERS